MGLGYSVVGDTTYNFKPENYQYYCRPEFEGKFFDSRNGIYCINPTMDVECYLNYIEMLNMAKSQWTNYGYLDLGMMPIAMGPSFMQETVVLLATTISIKYGFECFPMPPVSLMYKDCRVPEDDLWAFKSDVAKATGIPENELTLSRLLKEAMK